MSFQKFSLHPQVLSGVKAVGFETPTPIQEQAIPVALEGRDLLGLAQTGTGKTAAFALPILHHLASTPPKRGIRYLIIAPTRELVEQINDTFNELGQHLRIKSVTVYGGVAKGPQLNRVRRGAQIAVACPGRLLDHVSQKDIDLTNVEVLVLDEADTMCDMGFLPDVQRILNHLPSKRQTLFFSATMPKEIRGLAVKILKDPETIQIGTIAPAETVSHSIYPVPDKLKRDLLLALLEKTPTGRALVFTRTKHRARTLALELAKNRFKVGALQGNMSQNARQQAMNGFRTGKFDILVATDIAAHGIDVPEVSHVINFDFPNTTDTYTHRIGRTGRAEQTGEAFTFAGADDASMVRHVERELGIKIERRRLEGFNYGNFTPEEQFREDRMGLGRASGGRSNGGRAGQGTRDYRPNTGPNRRKPGAWKAGSTDYGRREDHPNTAKSKSNASNGNRTYEPVGAVSNGILNSENGRNPYSRSNSIEKGPVTRSNGRSQNRGQSNGGPSNGGGSQGRAPPGKRKNGATTIGPPPPEENSPRRGQRRRRAAHGSRARPP
ncbi:MAG: DEAD/DEAH box helicase [Chloroflexi bacterium]|nr:DEAD/DEAH box helicase [Chloroflexota bacterium]